MQWGEEKISVVQDNPIRALRKGGWTAAVVLLNLICSVSRWHTDGRRALGQHLPPKLS